MNILESFFYVADWQTENLHRFKSFMLDSGAFTFAYGSKEQVDLDSYLTRYIDYINGNDVELFFELDVDKLVGYQRVLEYRERLERETGKRSIPVWHISRGKDEWLKMVREYDYVALGGLAAKEFSNQERYIPWFTRTAHENGCKVHGLGYTKLPHLPYMGFDSVDSSAWLVGNRGGFLYRYNHDGFGWRAILSSVMGELVDSVVFFPIAFGGQMPVSALVSMAVLEICMKVGYEIIVLPITSRAVNIVSDFEAQPA